jgi:23S rRNA (guanosine2251-2'-O)-methyltransferase
VVAKVVLSAIPVADWMGRLGKTPASLILALDHVQDPRNLGAILRSAAFFGVRNVLVPERRQVLLTQASVATAQGGFALCDLVCTVNLGRTLRDLKDKGFWILGATMDGEAIPQVAGHYEKVVLVLGAEETGLSRSVEELCDRKVAIQGAGELDSLNVSVAAGILLNAFTNTSLRS